MSAPPPGAATSRFSRGRQGTERDPLLPRLLASRLNFLNPAYYARLHPFARKEALRSAIQLAGTVSTLLALASRVPGVKVNIDPTEPGLGEDPDRQHADRHRGRVPAGAAAARPARESDVAISSTTGKRLSLTAGEFGQPTRLGKAGGFFVGKESPIASLVTDWLRGSTQIGQKFTWGSAAMQRMIPLLGQDSYDLYKEKHGGMNGLAAAFAGYGVGSVGFGVQTYGPTAPKAARSAAAVRTTSAARGAAAVAHTTSPAARAAAAAARTTSVSE